MKRLNLAGIQIEGFRSFAELTTIEFGEPGGLRMLFGKNEVEPRLGGNGAGKSTLWDALCWCLFGFSARNLRAADLMNWSRKQNPHVIANLSINDAPFTVERFGSPNRLLLDGQPIEQDKLEREVLGISRARFMHSVLFGQMVRLFIDLTVPERGALLDEVLDLGLWLRASDTANARHRGLTAELQTIEKALAFSRGKLEGLESEDSLRAREDAWAAEHDAVIEAAIGRVDIEEAELSKATKHQLACAVLVQLAFTAPDNELDKQIRALHDSLSAQGRELGGLDAELGRENREAAFFRKAPDKCLTCSQPITAAFAAAELHTHETKAASIVVTMRRIDAAVACDKDVLTAAETKKRKRDADYGTAGGALSAAETAVTRQQRAVDLAVEAAEREASVTNPHTAQRETVRAQRSALQREVSKQRLQLGGIKEQLASLDYWRQGFKRVRLFQTKQSLDLLRIEVANAAQSLGLLGWSIDFVTEVETKSGTMKQGVQIVVTSPQASGAWEVWSGGEGQRIRLAGAIGLASLIQRMAGVFYTFEVWDEPSAWLSPEGITDLLDCLAQRAQITGKTVWVVDHRALDVGMFEQVWQVTKSAGGSSVARIS
jgi:DNA repair exonuclease SbcCD ATPase subunit